MQRPAVIKHLVSGFLERSPMRTTSLIITVFGDVVSQHGGVIWLGSLVRALDTLGISERLVRTSVFRLVRDGWLEFERAGRRSFYRFSDFGKHEYERAARRVYALEQESWHGRWQLLIPLTIEDKQRELFRRSLHWQGFRQIAGGTYARPGDADRTLRETLAEFDASGRVLIMEAESGALTSFAVVRKLVQESWKLDQVAQAYREFLAGFRPLARWLKGSRAVDAESAFIARTLLIHDYRRVLLRDTPLPEELLPPAWPGGEAMKLTGQLYLALAQPSIGYITTQLQADGGLMPGPKASFRDRFAPVAGTGR